MPHPGRITTMISVAPDPFMIEANVRNTVEMAGCPPEDLDILLLAGSDFPDRARLVIRRLSNRLPVRFARSPFNTTHHLHLVQWAAQFVELRDWFVIQHSDFFWKRRGWQPMLCRLFDSRPDAYHVALQEGINPFSVPPYCCHDYLGIWNTGAFKREKLSLHWGRHGHSFLFSPPVLEMMRRGDPMWRIGPVPVSPRWFFDGSQAATMELYYRWPDRVLLVNLIDWYDHLWEYFHMQDPISIVGDVLYIARRVVEVHPDMVRWLAQISAVQSFLYDRHDVHKAIPWVWMERLARFLKQQWALDNAFEVMKILEPYADPNRNALGRDDAGVRRCEMVDFQLPTATLL